MCNFGFQQSNQTPIVKNMNLKTNMNEKEVNETYPLIGENNHFVLDLVHERWQHDAYGIGSCQLTGKKYWD